MRLREKSREAVYKLRVQTGYWVGDPVDYEVGILEDLETAKLFKEEFFETLKCRIEELGLGLLVELRESEEESSFGWQACVELRSVEVGARGEACVEDVLRAAKFPGALEIKGFGGGVRCYLYKEWQVVWGY